MMLIYAQEDESVSHADRSAVTVAHRAFMEEAQSRGALLAADPLEPSATATLVRVHDGKAMVTDGPFAETKEQLAGYYILDCQDLDEALEWAARIPTACGGSPGCIEVRPIREFPRGEAGNG